jgi:hypothetical protein
MFSVSKLVRNSRHAMKAPMVSGVVASLFFTGMVEAKDLYVSTSGDNSVSYASNTINTPWATIEHGLYNLKAGDRLLVRGGTYSPRYPVWLNSDYSRQSKGGDPNEVNRAESGTASSPVVIENYNGEKPIVNLSAITAGSGVYINLDNKSYWTFRGLTFTNAAMVFKVGEDYATNHNVFENLNITATGGGDNYAPIHLVNYRADYTTIRNNVIKGPGQNVHLNTATIYCKGTNHLQITNNILSDAPIGIYFKHRNEATSASQVDVLVANNYIYNTSRWSLEYNGSFTKIQNNIFGANTAPAHFGDANGAAGADYNVIEHNTFLSGALAFDSATDSTDPFPGVNGNKVNNNIFHKSSEVLRYTSLTNTNTFGKNVYPSSTSLLSYSSLLKTTVDSLLGIATYVGGTSPTTIAGFALTSGSIGKGAATDGTDMGADVSKIQSGEVVTVAPPVSPGNVTVVVE